MQRLKALAFIESDGANQFMPGYLAGANTFRKNTQERGFLPLICADERRSNPRRNGFSFVFICVNLRQKIRGFPRCGREHAGAKKPLLPI
jgi:hypothetical protein